jgi:tetratricopeptide (TPR) repeat protein
MRLVARPAAGVPFPARAGAAISARPRVAVLVAAVLPTLWTLWNPLVLDDGWTSIDNPLVWSLRNLGRIFTEPYGYAGEASVRGPYRPLTTLSFALNYAVHGRWLPGYHLVNVALHAAASVLCWALALRLGRAADPARAPRIALLAGLVFALHPAHVESVATIFGRTDVLSTTFSLGALVLALDASGRAGPRAAARLLLAAAVLTCGVLSKEVAIVVPALFLVAAVLLPAAAGLPARPGLRTPAGRRALLRAALFAAALGLAFVPYRLGHGPGLAVAPVARWFPVGTPALHVALTMSRVLGEYLRILVFPSFLGGDFAYAARIPTLTAPTLAFAVATATWLLCLAAALLLWRREPLVSLGLLWIPIALSPVLNVVVPVGVLIAERLLYLPSVGFCLAAGAVLARVGRTRPGGALGPPASRDLRRRALAALPALLLALLFARTELRVRDWTTDVAFWRSELEKAPHEVVVNNNLAVAYTAHAQPAQALPLLEGTLAEHPLYWRAWVNLGIARGLTGDPAGGARAFAEAARLAPHSADPPRFLARLLEAERDVPGAIAALQQARRNAPEQAPLARELGALLLRAGRPADARGELEDAVRLDPADGAARALLGRAEAAARAAGSSAAGTQPPAPEGR